MRVYCLGNPYLKDDSRALELCKQLTIPGFEFVQCYKWEHIEITIPLIVVDVVEGLEDVRLVDLSELQQTNTVTAHDFDLFQWLTLMKKLNMLDELIIIGIPKAGELKEAKEKLVKLLSRITAQRKAIK